MKTLQILLTKVSDRIYLYLSSVFDFFLYQFGQSDTLSFTGASNIIFLGQGLAPRIPRMAKYIKDRVDGEVVLVCFHRTINAKFNPDNFDRVKGFRNSWHLKRILRGMNKDDVTAVHTFGPKCLYPSVAIQFLSKSDIKVYYDLQDAVVSNYGLHPPFDYQKIDLPYEKHCFEDADGIIAHSLEPLNAREVYNIRYNRVLFFPNYLDRIVPVSSSKLEGLHLVYLGGVAGSDKPARFFGCIQFFWLIRELTRQKIHLHIYRTPDKNFNFSEYYQEDKKNPYFHFHEPVAQRDVPLEISKYHFGILPFFNEDDERHPMKRKRSTSQKTFNYIEAGLPILVSEDLVYQSWISGKMGYSIRMKKDDFRNVEKKLRNLNYPDTLNVLSERRKKYHLNDKIHTLLDFYN